LYIVVPGRFLLFHTPASDIPSGQQWLDVDGKRRFGPGFYADLLGDMGVTQVQLEIDMTAAHPHQLLDYPW
jgi:hypothetical protein